MNKSPEYLSNEEELASACQVPCVCQKTKHRDSEEYTALLRRLSRDNPDLHTSIFNSIHSVCLDTMPGYKSRGVKHSFLEHYDEI